MKDMNTEDVEIVAENVGNIEVKIEVGGAVEFELELDTETAVELEIREGFPMLRHGVRSKFSDSLLSTDSIQLTYFWC